MVSDQWMLSILYRQLFINTCTFLMMIEVALQVSAPYNRTLIHGCFEFHMFFNNRNAVLVLPILEFTSVSEPPCSSIMLPRYVKESTSSRVSPSRVTGLLFSVLNLRMLGFPLVYVEAY
ncbi:unnamed protein product [Schistosoma curassoni]|uniref:Secreted protein n=1 Tax=Schistosoma curassoni TaxID=6186 RepID=A0A183JWB7_9TREM|nr:unnamed protein product [Schistosoma curassoni]